MALNFTVNLRISGVSRDDGDYVRIERANGSRSWEEKVLPEEVVTYDERGAYARALARLMNSVFADGG